MPIIIDCYNVLHQTMPSSLAGLNEAGLCRALARCGLGREKVTIVCDGGFKPGVPTSSPEPGIKLVYAGKGKSADDVIIELIAANSAPRRLVVVSSDREIQRAAKRRRATVLGAEHFIRELARLPHAPGDTPGSPPEYPSGNSPSAATSEIVQRWARLFGVDPEQRLD